jgi:hypothetical protein
MRERVHFGRFGFLGHNYVRIIDQMSEALKSTAVDWSTEAVDFIEATSSMILDELLDVSFLNIYSGSLPRLARSFF